MHTPSLGLLQALKEYRLVMLIMLMRENTLKSF